MIILNDLMTVLPQIVIAIGIIIVMMSDLFFSKKFKNITRFLTIVTLIVAIVICFLSYNNQEYLSFSGHVIHDHLSTVLVIFLLICSVLVFLYSGANLEGFELQKGSFYILGLMSVLGAIVLITAYSLLTLYIGLELLSLPLYALIAINRNSKNSAEAAIKYFVLGAISSGILLFGMSFLYGITGSIKLDEIYTIMQTLPSEFHSISILALVLMVSPVLFKLGIVPFHMWVPDVYEGSPTPTTLFLSSIPKIAAFAMLVHIVVSTFSTLSFQWHTLFYILGIASIFIGNIVALVQKNIKRLLAYSAISHMGFVLLGLTLIQNNNPYLIASFYLIIYIIMSLAVFGLLILLNSSNIKIKTLNDLNGLNDKNPWLAFLMMTIMFSMAGIPPFIGFYSKLFIISELIHSGYMITACYALLISVIASYYYVRVIAAIYFKKPIVIDKFIVEAPKYIYLIVSCNILGLLILGLFPELIISIVRHI